jgi:hypothetical protein
VIFSATIVIHRKENMVTLVLVLMLAGLVVFARKNARKLREEGYAIAPLLTLGTIALAVVIWVLASPVTHWLDKL